MALNDFREKTDNVVSNIKRNAKTILTDIVVVFLALFYVFYNVLKLELTKLNPWILLVKSILAIVVGIMIKAALGENGFDRGYRSDEWHREREKYDVKADAALPYIDKVDDFYERQRIEKTQKNRKTRLSGCRLKYNMFFDENGDYIEHEIWSIRHKKKYLKTHNCLPENVIALDLRQRLCLYKCVRLKIYVKNMFSEYESGLSADERKEKTDKIQRTHNLRKNTLKSVAFALAGVYVVATFSFNLGEMILAIFQVLGFVVVGILDALDNYYYVTVEKVAILREKQSDLARFLIENTSREEFTEKFVPKKEEEPKETVIELTQEQADALLGSQTKMEKTE